MSPGEIPWSAQAAWPLLAGLQLLPLAGAGLALVLRRGTLAILAGIALTGLELLLALALYHHYDPAHPALQFAERVSLAGWLDYHAAVDGVSILFILLTAFLSLLVAIYGPARGLGPPWRLMALILAIEASLMVMFTTLNLLWFILALALQIGLVGAVLRHWATSPRMGPALKTFYKFMGTALALLLAGALIIGWGQTHAQGGGWTFDLIELRRLGVEPAFQTLAFYLLFYGLAIRTPLFPLHGWLPPLAEHGNIALAPTFLLGLKVGIYGLLRFVLPLLPAAVQEWQSFVVGFAVVG
ncbi:MAG: NADH-quinone oxidoreductase subunit L, partial [Gammaproteobacteria bacterium]